MHNTSYKGESLKCIKVSPEILKYDIWKIEQPWEALGLYTDEEMEVNKMNEEDESIELDFNDDLEIELLEVQGIEKNEEDTSK